MREELMVRLRADAVLGPLGLEDEIARRKLLHEENWPPTGPLKRVTSRPAGCCRVKPRFST